MSSGHEGKRHVPPANHPWRKQQILNKKVTDWINDSVTNAAVINYKKGGGDHTKMTELKIQKHNPVDSPPHYTQGGIETIGFIEAKMSQEQFKGYLLGNVFKYTSRFQYKNGVEDLKKARWYLKELIDMEENHEDESADIG